MKNVKSSAHILIISNKCIAAAATMDDGIEKSNMMYSQRFLLI